jgi:hypothetical protein
MEEVEGMEVDMVNEEGGGFVNSYNSVECC